LIEEGDWHHLYQGDTPGYTMGDLAADLRELYNLHGDHNLLFRYQNCIIVDGEQKKQWVNLSEWEVLENKLIITENNVDRQLTLSRPSSISKGCTWNTGRGGCFM